jgi:hypothetical protein
MNKKDIIKATLSGIKHLEGELSWDEIDGVDILDIEEWLEKQGEDKPADDPATEPKFKSGEWITNGEYTWLITNVDEWCYCIESPVSGRRVRDTIMNIDSHFHLWTINDAKDKDILVASDNSVFLYKKSSDDSAKFYAAVSHGALLVDNGTAHWERNESCHPGTEGQKNSILSMLEKEGYQWDESESMFVKNDNKTVSQTMPHCTNSDEAMVKNIIQSLEYYRNYVQVEQLTDIVNSQIDWLKKLTLNNTFQHKN